VPNYFPKGVRSERIEEREKYLNPHLGSPCIIAFSNISYLPKKYKEKENLPPQPTPTQPKKEKEQIYKLKISFSH
jgi:hypothetical protein